MPENFYVYFYVSVFSHVFEHEHNTFIVDTQGIYVSILPEMLGLFI